MLKAILFDFNRTLYDPDQGELFPGVWPMLQDFKSQGLKQGLVSFGGAEKEKLIQELGLAKMVDWYVVVSDKTPEIFLSFAQQFNLKNEETLVVGDLANNEIKIGQELGMKTVWLKAGKFANEPTTVVPDHIIRVITELVGVVTDLRG